jgi:hypothetical protein
MTNNSDLEISTSPRQKTARTRRLGEWVGEIVPRGRSFWWAGGVAVLIALLAWASWLARKRQLFSAFWEKWNELQQSPALSPLFLPLGLATLALLVIVLWKVPQWQVGRVKRLSSKERFDRVNEARKTLATILGGVLLLLGFFGTWQNLRVAQEALSVSQQGQITDRFTKAIEQLGATDARGR